MPLHIDAIPAFNDNYIWLLYKGSSDRVWVVDPGDATPVLKALRQLEAQRQRPLTLEGVLITHHHGDHDGGVPALRQQFPALRVAGGLHGESPYLTERLADNDKITVLGQQLQILDVPGHTRDHIAFYNPEACVLFCGDTLFAGGCGRLFEGSAAQMHQSLSRIAGLAPNTLLYCAHEYTQANLRFAQTAEPENPVLQQRIGDTKALRARGQATVPSLLSLELATNPFLRCHEPSIMAAVREQMGDTPATPLAVFTVLRAWKDHF